MLKPFLNCGHSWEKGFEDEWMPRALVLLEGEGDSTTSSDSAPPSSDTFGGDFGFQSWGFDSPSNDNSNTSFNTDSWGSPDGGGFQTTSDGGFNDGSSFQSTSGGYNDSGQGQTFGGDFGFQGYGYTGGGDYQGGYNFSGDLNSGNIGLDSLSGQAFNSGAYSGGGGWAGGGPFGSGGSNFTYGTGADQNTGGGPFGTATGRDGGGPFGGWSSGFGGPPSDVTGQLSGSLTGGSGLIANTNIADQGQPETPDALNTPQFDLGDPNAGQMPQGQGDGLPGWQVSADPNQAQTYGPPSITGQDLQDLVAAVTGREAALPTLDPAAISAFEGGQQGRAGSRDPSYFPPSAGGSRSGMDMEFNPFGMYQAPTQENQGTQGLPGRSEAPSLMDMIGINQARAADDMPNVSQSWGGQTRAEAARDGFLPQQPNELNMQMLDALGQQFGRDPATFQTLFNEARANDFLNNPNVLNPQYDPTATPAGNLLPNATLTQASPFGTPSQFTGRAGDMAQQGLPGFELGQQARGDQTVNTAGKGDSQLSFDARFSPATNMPPAIALNPYSEFAETGGRGDVTGGAQRGGDDTFASRFGENNPAVPVAESPYAVQYGNPQVQSQQSQQMTPTNQSLYQPGWDFMQPGSPLFNPTAGANPLTDSWMASTGPPTAPTAFPGWAQPGLTAGLPNSMFVNDTSRGDLRGNDFNTRFGDLADARPIAETPLSQYQAPPNTQQSIMQAQVTRGGEPNWWDQEPNITPDELRPDQTQAPARGSPDRGATQQERGVNPQDRGDIRSVIEQARPAIERQQETTRAPTQVTVGNRSFSAPPSQAGTRGAVQAQMDSLLNTARSANTLSARVQALDQLNGLISQYGNPYVGRGVTDPDINVRGGGPVYGTGIFRR
jgi:hypothetical protein